METSKSEGESWMWLGGRGDALGGVGEKGEMGQEGWGREGGVGEGGERFIDEKRGVEKEARGEGGGLSEGFEKGGGLDVGGECPGEREIFRL